MRPAGRRLGRRPRPPPCYTTRRTWRTARNIVWHATAACSFGRTWQSGQQAFAACSGATVYTERHTMCSNAARRDPILSMHQNRHGANSQTSFLDGRVISSALTWRHKL